MFALAAGTGRELWTFDPKTIPGVTASGVNRGLVYWASGEDCRILYGNDPFIHALDAGLGRPVAGFSKGGHIGRAQRAATPIRPSR